MYITKLQLHNFRNIQSQTYEFTNDINFIIGKNGSGKTSILESIYYLSHNRSFRSSQLNKIINHYADELIIFTKAPSHDGTTISLSRKKMAIISQSLIMKYKLIIQKLHERYQYN